MKRILGALLVSTALLAPAVAADLARPVYKAAPLVPVWSWTGFYIGGHWGHGWGEQTQDLTGVNVNGTQFNTNDLALANFTTSGFLAGGQVGANYQFDRFVVGIEGEGDWADVKGHGPCIVVATCSSNTKWLADVSGRVGLAVDRALVYAKAGYAWAGVDSNIGITIAGIGINSPTSQTRSGFLLGGGVEYAITDHWTAKIEYDYIDFGTSSVSSPLNITGLPARVTVPPISLNTNIGDTMQIVKAGFNYKF